jgi:hypothetical protein
LKIFLATGYSVMNPVGREQEIRDMFGMRRLFSYADHQNKCAKVTRCLEVYSDHIYSKREGESEL